MNVTSKDRFTNCECDECGKLIKADKDTSFLIIVNKKHITLCEGCFTELKIKMTNTWSSY